MTRILAVANQKGGVGKTTTCINLAASLAATKKRTLMVDMDPQGNATMGSGVDKNDLALSVYDVLVGAAPVAEVTHKNLDSGFHVVPANGDLTAAEVELLKLSGKERRLAEALAQVSDSYDYILVDCPPSLNMLTLNALVAADGVIVPMQCEYYALEGLSALLSTIQQIKDSVNPRLQVEGILRTMYDPRSSLTVDVSSQLSEFFGDKLYRTCIPRNVRLAEAPSFGKPALAYDKNSKGAIAYLAWTGEILRRATLGQAVPA